MKKIFLITVLILSLTIGCSGNENSVNKEAYEQKDLVETKNDTKKDVDIKKEPELPGAVLVMVDNYVKARPQSGLDKADIVYEMMAEGGITRYMAVYYSEKADVIGPVRSARYYFVELAKGYNAPLAHAGGSQEALALIQRINIKDLDEIYNAGGYFWRDNKEKMPHNLYTGTDKLIKGANKKGYKVIPPPTIIRGNIDLNKAKDGENFAIDYSAGTYKYLVSWQYNGMEYERFINNKPHVMRDGTNITADNVIVISAQTSTYIKDGVPLSDIKIVGKGKAQYFINGQMFTGGWVKESSPKPLIFLDEKGENVIIKEGKVWVQVVPNIESVIIN